MMPSMMPFYLLLGRSLAGISLFAIIAEAIALFFIVRIASLLEHTGEWDRSRLRHLLALYLLNPATLYWTVFQGYHSIVQTAYSMAALYLLLRGHYKTGYGVGLFSLAGAKLIAPLDWPALLLVSRPRLSKLLLGAIPLVCTYLVYQLITGDILFPLRFHLGYTGEGNIWYLTTMLGRFDSFYSSFPGSVLPILSFGGCFLIGVGLWVKHSRADRISYSFQAAIGATTFTMSLFFLFSLYTGGYYVPMLMLPACIVATDPAGRSRYGVWSVLLISALCVSGDALWASLGQPATLVDPLFSGSMSQRLICGLLILSIVVRILCFAKLAQLGLNAALGRSQCGQLTTPALA
jgi:hypothetical protein